MSPAVTMALFTEVGAEGPVSRTVLGVVVVADLLVVVLFAVVSSFAKSVMGGATDVAGTALHLSWELFGSLVVGALVGVVLSIYLRKVREGRALFVLLLCVVMSEVGGRVGLDPLLVALSAGLFIENVTEIEASELVHDIEAASLPVYVVFFGLAGAMLDLAIFAAVAVPALIVVLTRAAGMWFGARTGARWVGAPPDVQKWTFVGLLPQAGLALALALLIPEVFPDFGRAAAALIVGIVGINELVMPAVLRWGLVRIGEARGLSSDEASPPKTADAPANG
jgi:Kef-type K+ transport system membrane component KefB